MTKPEATASFQTGTKMLDDQVVLLQFIFRLVGFVFIGSLWRKHRCGGTIWYEIYLVGNASWLMYSLGDSCVAPINEFLH
jgi:hypothetical protein